MADNSTKKAYELLEKKRLANIEKNLKEGRTGKITGIPAYDKALRSADVSNVIEDLKKQGKVTNLENTLKMTPPDTIGINPEVRNKSKFFNLDKKLGVAEDVVDEAQDSGLLKNTKGYAKYLPMLGLGATALAGLSIANKVQAGELGEAGAETADLATDYVPGVGQLKMLANPSELGNAELPEDEMEARRIYNEQMRKGKLGEKVSHPNVLNVPELNNENPVRRQELIDELSARFKGLNKLK